jgi:hypothetical protein
MYFSLPLDLSFKSSDESYLPKRKRKKNSKLQRKVHFCVMKRKGGVAP